VDGSGGPGAINSIALRGASADAARLIAAWERPPAAPQPPSRGQTPVQLRDRSVTVASAIAPSPGTARRSLTDLQPPPERRAGPVRPPHPVEEAPEPTISTVPAPEPRPAHLGRSAARGSARAGNRLQRVQQRPPARTSGRLGLRRRPPHRRNRARPMRRRETALARRGRRGPEAPPGPRPFRMRTGNRRCEPLGQGFWPPSPAGSDIHDRSSGAGERGSRALP